MIGILLLEFLLNLSLWKNFKLRIHLLCKQCDINLKNNIFFGFYFQTSHMKRLFSNVSHMKRLAAHLNSPHLLPKSSSSALAPLHATPFNVYSRS